MLRPRMSRIVVRKMRETSPADLQLGARTTALGLVGISERSLARQAKLKPHFCLLSPRSHSRVTMSLPILLKHCPRSDSGAIVHRFAIGSPHDVLPQEAHDMTNCHASKELRGGIEE